MRGSSAGILLLLLAVIGLVALFTGNLDRLIAAFAGPAGGPEGLGGSPSAVQDRSPQPAAAPASTSGGAAAADAARRGGFRED
jgi:hypothetical protein